MTDCMHGLELATCGVCTPPPGESGSHTRGPWFAARYDGECDECGAMFWAGEQIRSDGSGGWLCEQCG